MSGSQLQVRLYRDSFNTPWGFRLQGGKDLGQALSIQRVFSNSPAEGELQRGDLILAIGGREGSELTHKQALDLIKHGGGQIQLVIQRPAPGRVSSTATFKPQRPRAPSLQQPPPSQQPMPASGSYGFQPKKVTLSNLGGGGPTFGSDFTHYKAPVTQPVHVHTGGRGPQHNAEMLNRVQESLDNISLSPRTPDYYQPPPFASPTSPGGQYIPTGIRLDMEREREREREQEHRRQQQQQQQQQQQLYQQQQQQYQSPPQQQYYEPQQSGYVATGIRLEQQMGEEEQGEFQPVWQRRKTFMNAPSKPAPAPTGKSSVPKIPRPKPGDSRFTFGVDYTKPQAQKSSITWKPQPVQRPVNVAPPQPEVVQSTPPWGSHQVDQSDGPPAWRTSLKTTGVKPWDVDLDYVPGQQQAPSGGSQVQNPPKPGDRDWTQSAVYRMIYEEEHRRGPGKPAPTQHHQQQAPAQHAPPPPAPKPVTPTFQQSYTPIDDEFGTSDF